MNKFLILTALLLSTAPAVRGEKRDIGFPQWIADYSSLELHGSGAPMNWAAWTDAKYGIAGRRIIPSGTAVSLVSGKIVPATGAADTLLLMSNANEGSPTDSVSGYGLVTGGNVYEAALPDSTGAPAVLPTPVRAKATRFYLQ